MLVISNGFKKNTDIWQALGGQKYSRNAINALNNIEEKNNKELINKLK